jgi:hypothetical protein
LVNDSGEESAALVGFFTRFSSPRSFAIGNYLVFEPTNDGEDDEGQERTHDSQTQASCTRGDANGCSEPDARSGRYSHNLMLLAHFEDDAAADEANPSESSLDYPAHVRTGHPIQMRYENHDSGPKRYKHVGPHSRCFAYVGSLQAQDAAESDGDEKTHGDTGHLDIVGKTGNQLLPQSRTQAHDSPAFLIAPMVPTDHCAFRTTFL